MYKVFWLTCFRNRTKVPFDQFIYNLGLYAQIYSKQEFLRSFINEFLKEKLTDPTYNYEVDLAKDGAKLIKLVVNGITSNTTEPDETKDPSSVVTVRSEGTEIIAGINNKDFDLIEILNDFILPIKVGNGNKITTNITSGKEISQDYLSIGSYPFNDIILNRHFPIGLNTVIYSTGDKLRITDYSNLSIPQARSAIESKATELSNLSQGDFVNLGGVPTYKVTSTNPLTLTHVFDLKKEGKDLTDYKPL